MNAVIDISKSLKRAREAKGLSQRTLADLSGVPQSHISKIESGGVDLRISSLVEIALALDMELKLVPRKGLSAVNSIIRSTQAKAQSKSMLDVMAKLQRAADQLNTALAGDRGVAQLRSRINELSRISLPPESEGKLKALAKQLQKLITGKTEVSSLQTVLEEVNRLRNEAVHQRDSEPEGRWRSAYSLDGDDDA
ncbi:helix-turn-helix domain-containing protein [Zhongshania aquimaris]|uniref:Helix-turn-helix domain-containing protein n=1 Tax=Zhongshania aquimaris TaxID=2857107 RepID=A0ABS6VSS5_9GAMM|nr:helix-turn-helix transcriptional regulator [Zhongshania aquimaris]MBW2940810.1 helix-turn-helix domain-containing protein [Zhongshania aquimaris]